MLSILTGIGGILGNVATNNMPKLFDPYLWLSWPLFIIITTVAIALTIYERQQASHDALREQTRVKEKGIPPINHMSADSLKELQPKLISRCSLSDLKDLCFVLGIDYEDYPVTKSDFVRELLLDLSRKNLESAFLTTLRDQKPWVLK